MRLGIGLLLVAGFCFPAAAQNSTAQPPSLPVISIMPGEAAGTLYFDIILPPTTPQTELPEELISDQDRARRAAVTSGPTDTTALPIDNLPIDKSSDLSPATADNKQPSQQDLLALPLPPKLDDSSAAIAMVPGTPMSRPSTSTPAIPSILPDVMNPMPVPPELASKPVLTSPLPTVHPTIVLEAAPALTRETLDRALAEITRLQPLPAPVLEGIRSFYDERGFKPVWSQTTGVNTAGNSVLDRLSNAGQDGLDPSRFRKLTDLVTDAKSSVETRDIALSAAAVLYARDARGARLHPSQVSRLITATTTMPDTAAVLKETSLANLPGDRLRGYNPAHPGYLALRRMLEDLKSREITSTVPQPRLTHGPLVKPGMKDPRVPLLRSLLGLSASDETLYGADLAQAVKTYQKDHQIPPSGNLNRRTVAALGGIDPETVPEGRGITDIVANMERWRWLPTDLGQTHVFVNIPSYSLQMMRDGVITHRTRVIVGKPNTQTPVFSHRIQFLVVNPYWNVPPSIAMKELLPLVQKNPLALQARGLEVVSRGRVVDPTTIDWNSVGRSVSIRQPPGERNALGNIKFMFPNEHAVYLHDTPSRGLFVNDRRAYSHGCVRVQDPFSLADHVMGPDWNERKLRSMIGGPERQVRLPREVPVHLAYFTTLVDETGNLQFREDIYGHNRRVKALLGL